MRTLSTLLILVVASLTLAQIDVDNGLADRQIINKPKADKYVRKCEIKGKPLDLMYLVDSSGSVGKNWQQTLTVLKDLTNFVTIAPDGSATRISFVLYASKATNLFDFNTYFRREDINARMEQIQPINGITNMGLALNETLQYFTEERGARGSILEGMRGPTVPKVIFHFGDGRASDYPLERNAARVLREQYGIKIFAFGLGEYLDFSTLIDVVGGNRDHVANSRDVGKIFDWFKPWKGIEICEEVPACVPGAHKPLDLMFVVDTSSSVESSFRESINFVSRIMNNVNVHPEAVQVSLITYASRPKLEFKFNDFRSNEEVTKAMLDIPQQKGTTATSEALKMASDTFDPLFGARNDDKTRRLAIIVTDGHSTRSPGVWARRLKGLKNVDLFAVGLDAEMLDYNELKELVVGEEDHIYIGGRNILQLQKDLLEYADTLCPGLEGVDGNALSLQDYETFYLDPYMPQCNADGLVVEVRTRNPFNGVIFAVGYDKQIDCQAEGQQATSTQVIIKRGSCGIKVEPVENGYTYTVRLGIRYHQYVHSNADETFEVTCRVPERYDPTVDTRLALDATPVDLDNNLLIAAVSAAQCEYKLVDVSCRFRGIKSPNVGCKFLDAQVGTVIEHEWRCSMPAGHRFLVHDCVVESEHPEDNKLNVLSNEGCQVDAVLLPTPKYNPKSPSVISQRSTAFKFPNGNSLRYKCLVSICDMGGVQACKYMFERLDTAGPVACKNEGPLYEAARLNTLPVDYTNPPQTDAFVKTVAVHSRVLNVYQKKDFSIASLTKNKLKKSQFCSTLN